MQTSKWRYENYKLVFRCNIRGRSLAPPRLRRCSISRSSRECIASLRMLCQVIHFRFSPKNEREPSSIVVSNDLGSRTPWYIARSSLLNNFAYFASRKLTPGMAILAGIATLSCELLIIQFYIRDICEFNTCCACDNEF